MMKEFVYDFREFKEKVSTVDPIHHSCTGSFIDREGLIYELTFRIYGVSKQGGHIILMTQDEYARYRKRLYAIYEKGFEIKVHA
jgi:hypothetical protein